MEIELEPVMYEDLEADGSFNTKSNIGIKEEDNSSLSTSDNVRVSSASSSPCTNTREITCNEDVAGIAEDSSSCRSIQEKDDKRFRPVVNHSTQRLQGRTIRNRKVKGGRQRKMKSSLPSSNIVPLWKSDLRNEHADGGASESDDSNEKDSMDNPGTIFSDEHRTAMQHILNQKPFQCTICKKAFGVKSSLMHHLKFHTGEKPFACPVCKKSFITKDHLARHIRVHTGERPYKCSVCTKSFSMKHHLTAHLRLHTGEKPFQCVACKRSFTQRAHLTDHLRFHSGEKPYQCSFCGKTFTLRSSLTHHLRVHSSEKPFECSVCSKLFTNKGDLTCHHRVHTGEKPYECTVCRKTFTKRSNLTRHNKTHVEHLQDLV